MAEIEVTLSGDELRDLLQHDKALPIAARAKFRAALEAVSKLEQEGEEEPRRYGTITTGADSMYWGPDLDPDPYPQAPPYGTYTPKEKEPTK